MWMEWTRGGDTTRPHPTPGPPLSISVRTTVPIAEVTWGRPTLVPLRIADPKRNPRSQIVGNRSPTVGNRPGDRESLRYGIVSSASDPRSEAELTWGRPHVSSASDRGSEAELTIPYRRDSRSPGRFPTVGERFPTICDRGFRFGSAIRSGTNVGRPHVTSAMGTVVLTEMLRGGPGVGWGRVVSPPLVHSIHIR